MMDSTVPLVRLRDLAADDRPYWNVDLLYILAVEEPSAWRLIEIAETWHADSIELSGAARVNDLMGISGTKERVLVTVWWD